MTNLLNTKIKGASITKSFLLALLTLIITTTFTTSSSAQGWKNSYLIGVSDHAETVAECLDGGFIIAGRSSSVYSSMVIAKTNIDGELQWSKILPHNYDESVYKIVPTPDGGYLLAGYSEPSSPNDDHRPIVVKIDAFGDIVWEQIYGAGLGKLIAMEPTLDGNYIAIGHHHLTGIADGTFLVKIDGNGTVIWEETYAPVTTYAKDIYVNDDGTFTTLSDNYIDGETILMHIDANGAMLWNTTYPSVNEISLVRSPDGGYLLTGDVVIKTDSLGVVEWTKELFPTTDNGFYSEVAKADDGYVIAALSNVGTFTAVAVKIDFQGNIMWRKDFPSPRYSQLHAVTVLENGGYIFGGNDGYYDAAGESILSMFIAKFDEQGNMYSNILTGNIFNDLNGDCALDSLDAPLNNWLIEADGLGDFYGFANQTGNYSIDVPADTYVLSVKSPSPLWKSCEQAQTVQVSQNDTITNDFPQKAIVDCPYLQVDLSTPFLRRCFNNTYTVQYKNTGTISANSAYVELTFDPFIIVNSSSLPWSSQIGNTYVFLVGDLEVNETGQFTVNVTISCDAVLGQTHCVEAHIYPDDHCTAPLGIWDGSITQVEGECLPDSLAFSIKNVGAGDMANPLEYFVVEDNLIMKTGAFQLISGGELQIKMPSNGSTYRLYAEQAPGYFPAGYKPTVAIEGCGVNPSTNEFSLGFITEFAEDDHMPYLSIDCQENIGSFDPNDKRAEPKGFGEEHLITRNDELDYHIRFQNVGTDTAFTVVVRDTLSSFLDISSIIQGAASHPYDLEIINGHILKYTFNDILLVDSTTNEAASHGFIKFRIAQEENLALGTVINNSAAVYFDFNEPIITNETYHKIGEDHIQIIQYINDTDYPLLAISVAPNPFSECTNFTVEGVLDEKHFQLFDAMGKLISADAFEGTDYRFYNKGLSTGVYFYTILGENGLLGSGKLVVE